MHTVGQFMCTEILSQNIWTLHITTLYGWKQFTT